MTRRPFVSRCAQSGFTLIELMVSLVIGLVVVGALLAAYFASFTSSRHSDAMTQMAEDATLALSVIRNQVAQGGFSAVTGVAAGLLQRNAIPAPIMGCEGANFADADAADGTATCAAAGSGTPPPPDAIEVAYEAALGTGSNAILVGGKPVDCVGNTYAVNASGWYLNDSKFYIDSTSKALVCHGSSGTAAALVDHVENLQIRYGITNGPWGNAGSAQVAYYATADKVSTNGLWAQVGAVSICVQVTSADRVIPTDSSDPLGKYIDCDTLPQQSTDGYLRRTFTTTVVVQNQML